MHMHVPASWTLGRAAALRGGRSTDEARTIIDTSPDVRALSVAVRISVSTSHRYSTGESAPVTGETRAHAVVTTPLDPGSLGDRQPMVVVDAEDGPGPDRLDPARIFVTHDVWEFDVNLAAPNAFDDMQIRATDARTANANDHGVAANRRLRHRCRRNRARHGA